MSKKKRFKVPRWVLRLTEAIVGWLLRRGGGSK
jgi:hypothetical protein